MKRTPLKRHSAKGLEYIDELDELRPFLDIRSRGRCEIAGHLPCCGRVVPHHRKRRSQGGPNTLENLLMVCEWHHTQIHGNPLWSYKHGYLIHREDDITPLEVR